MGILGKKKMHGMEGLNGMNCLELKALEGTCKLTSTAPCIWWGTVQEGGCAVIDRKGTEELSMGQPIQQKCAGSGTVNVMGGLRQYSP